MRAVVYLFVTAATAYTAILYRNFSLTCLFAAEVFMAVFSAVILLSLHKKISAEISIPIPVADRGQKVGVQVRVRNRGWFPAARVRIRTVCRQQFGEEREAFSLNGSVADRGETVLRADVSASFSGRVFLTVRDIRVSDYLGILTLRMPAGQEAYFHVMPEIYDVPLLVSEQAKRFSGDSDIFDEKKSGDDVSEIFQIREYRGGDRMQRVHWKMSARTDELMVKDYSLPLGYPVILFLSFQKSGKRRENFEKMLSAAISVSFALAREQCRHYLAWYQGDEQRIVRVRLENDEQIYGALEAVYGAVPYSEEIDVRELYREQFPGELWMTDLEFTPHLTMIRNGEEQIPLPGADDDIQLVV